MSNPIRLAVLYSAPLVWHDDRGRAHPIDVLDFNAERDYLFDSFSKAGRAIEVRIETATADNLRTLVTLGYRALHYSGHGHPDFLAFEDGRGVMHLLSADMLRRLFAAGGTHGVQMVFVSACHSRRAAEAFVEAGVPHVVAVRLETPVYDIAARTFARAFYLALAAGKTVKQAFDIGKAAVASQPGLSKALYESGKFLLLPEYGYHEVAIFADVPIGEWHDVTLLQSPNNLPAIPENFIGRNVDMQKVVGDILDRRLVTVRGAPGIGKTALAIAAAHYVSERRFFRDGVFFVPLREVKSAEAVRFAVAHALCIEARNDNELFAALRRCRALFLLDNSEDLLHHAGSDFRRFLSQLLQQAKDVKLLLTSREAVGGGLTGVAEKIQPLHRLDPEHAARLFVALAPRQLTCEELGTDDPDKAIEILARHPVLDFLSGHPHAISLAVPLLQDKSLTQLYELLQKQKIEALQVAGVAEEERDAVNSFVVSLSVSVNYQRETNPNVVLLFAVMGLLPSGALDKDLDAIWGDGWRPMMDALVRASLVERTELGNMEHFSTFPFITAYAESLLTKDDRTLFAIRVCEHFSEMSGFISQTIGTEQASTAHALLSIEEGNLRACLDMKRPARSKQENEDMSPTALIATNLPQILLFAYRADDGIHAAELGYKACHALGETLGEANTLKALGDLKVRVDDLDGARRDYETALPIYREIHARLGEANCRQGLGNLLIAEGKPDSALTEFQTALEIHIQVQNLLGIGAALLFMGRAETSAERYNQAAELFEMALSIYRGINDRWGQALALEDQADALWAREARAGATAARWQARQIFRATGISTLINCSQFSL